MNAVRKSLLVCVLVVIWTAAGTASGGEDAVNEFLSADGRLKETLELRDAQEGFVGVTGTVWMIDPSGAWYIADFVNEQVSEPKKQGHFSKDQLAAVAQLLASGSFDELPAQFGRDLKVNRHMVTIGFGRTKSTLVLNTAEPATLTAAATLGGPHAAAAGRFLSIVEGTQSLLNKN